MNIFSFSFIELTFQFFCQKISHRIVKIESYVSTGNLGRKIYIFWKKISCSYRFRKWAKKIRPSGKFFGQGCANCFRPVDGFILRSFSEKQIRYILSFSHTEQNLFGLQSEIFQQGRQKELSKLFIISRHWAKNFRPFVKKIAAVLPKLHSTCLQEQFEWTFFLKKSLQFLLYYSDTERKNFGLLSIFFRRSCQKCFLHIHGNISTETIF